MTLGSLAMVGLALLVPSADGAFVGTLVAADASSLVVRAEDGGEERFLLDPESDMPAGFVTGTRIVVRFEALGDGRFRAASVSPPRIPLEADVLSTLPTRSQSESRPSPEATRPARRVSSPSSPKVPLRTSSLPARPPAAAPPQRAQASPPTPAAAPSALVAPAVAAPSDAEARLPAKASTTPSLTADWPLLLAALLGACALLVWGLLRYR